MMAIKILVIIVHICYYQNDIKLSLKDKILKLGCVLSVHHFTIEISNLVNEIIN
jgi:hypothetical protein